MQKDLVAQFVSELIKKAGLDNVPEKFREEYAEKIGAEVQRRIGLVALKELSPQALDEFNVLAGKDAKPDELAEFFKKSVPDWEDKITVALKEFSDEFLASSEKLKKATT